MALTADEIERLTYNLGDPFKDASRFLSVYENGQLVNRVLATHNHINLLSAAPMLFSSLRATNSVLEALVIMLDTMGLEQTEKLSERMVEQVGSNRLSLEAALVGWPEIMGRVDGSKAR